MARRYKKTHKKLRRHSHRRNRGGGYIDNPLKSVAAGYVVHTPYPLSPDCNGNPLSQRPGHISSSTFSGLPGMNGGQRVGFSMPGVSTALGQTGGRYESNLDGSILSPSMIATPPLATSIKCEGGIQNPLNLRGGNQSIVMGQQQQSAGLQQPNAGFTHNFETRGGVPLMINTPIRAGEFNRACITTGGRRRHKKTRRHSRRRSKHSRK